MDVLNKSVHCINLVRALTLLGTLMWLGGLGWFALLKYWKWHKDPLVTTYLIEGGLLPSMSLACLWCSTLSVSMRASILGLVLSVMGVIAMAVLISEIFGHQRILGDSYNEEFWSVVTGFLGWAAVDLFCLIAQLVMLVQTYSLGRLIQTTLDAEEAKQKADRQAARGSPEIATAFKQLLHAALDEDKARVGAPALVPITDPRAKQRL